MQRYAARHAAPLDDAPRYADARAMLMRRYDAMLFAYAHDAIMPKFRLRHTLMHACATHDARMSSYADDAA